MTTRLFLRAAALAALIAGAGAVQATPTQLLAYKVVDNASASSLVSNIVTAWTTAANFNVGDATAASLTDTTKDYVNGGLISNWAQVQGVQVAMIKNGAVVKSLNFNPGTSSTNFYSKSNLTSSSYTDLAAAGTNFFGILGDPTYGRDFFINANYGGCGADTGWWIALDANSSKPCAWEVSNSSALGSSARGFLYSNAATLVNWNSAIAVGRADAMAIFLTVDVPNGVPEPTSAALVGAALALAYSRRRNRV